MQPQCLRAAAAGDLPRAHWRFGTVQPAGERKAAVSAETQGLDVAGGTFENVFALSAVEVPEAQRFVVSGAERVAAAGSDLNGVDFTDVTAESFQTRSGRDRPK